VELHADSKRLESDADLAAVLRRALEAGTARRTRADGSESGRPVDRIRFALVVRWEDGATVRMHRGTDIHGRQVNLGPLSEHHIRSGTSAMHLQEAVATSYSEERLVTAKAATETGRLAMALSGIYRGRVPDRDECGLGPGDTVDTARAGASFKPFARIT